jgi:hypothetical protein
LEFYAIARSLNPRAVPVPKAVRRKLILAYGGADDPAHDNDRTIVARNTQFELWVAAWLTAGRKPVRIAEPDIQFAFRFQWCGLAAKRVRAPGQIVRRVRQAAEQVQRNTGTGFIALALDNYSLARRIRSRTELKAGARFFAAYREIEDAADWLMSKATHIRAFLCFGHYARWLPGEEPPSLQMSNLTRIYMLPSDATDAEYMNAYFPEHGAKFREAWRKI